MRSAVVTLLLIMTITASAIPSRRLPRQSCNCTDGESAKCSCKALTPVYPGRNVQMACSCTTPVPPRCVCEGASNQLSPPLPPPQMMSTRPPYNSCVEQCEVACARSCTAAQFQSKCSEDCSHTCHFSCLKQEKPKTDGQKTQKKADYTFIMPKDTTKTQTTTETTLTFPTLPLLPYGSPLPTTPTPSFTVSQPTFMPKVCEAECMPDCSVSCVALRPALKLLNNMMEAGSTNSLECLKSCTATCEDACLAAGLIVTDCRAACGPTCQKTCQISQKQCAAPCMPSCWSDCIEEVELHRVSGSLRPVTMYPVVAGQWMEVNTSTSTKPQPQCDHECAVQCARQCALHQLSGPKCEAACQTTCIPICQSSMVRRRHHQPRQ